MSLQNSFDADQSVVVHAGYLHKYTNFLGRYQERWFVLKGSELSYYIRPEEIHVSCRGSINLASAELRSMDRNFQFSITSANNTVYVLRAHNETDFASWISKIKTTITRGSLAANRAENSHCPPPVRPSARPTSTSKLDAFRPASVVSKIKNIAKKNSVVETVSYKNNQDGLMNDVEIKSLFAENEKLNLQVQEFDYLLKQTLALNTVLTPDQKNMLASKCQKIVDTNNAIISFQYSIFKNINSKYKIIQQEHKVLLQQTATSEPQDPSALIPLNQRQDSYDNANANPAPRSESSSLEFFDAQDGDFENDLDSNDRVPTPISEELFMAQCDNTRSSITNDPDYSLIINGDFGLMTNKDVVNVANETGARPISRSLSSDMLRVDQAVAHRKVIPDKPKNTRINLFAMIKSAIGKDLTKIPMPVQFNEPLSMLQRAAECMENYQLLDRAAAVEDSTQQMCYVVGFTVAAFASTAIRTTKPFNPILNETFELDRMTDLGWRLISEQVSHHPPISAMHVAGRNWVFEETNAVSAKFRGKYMSVSPKGMNELTIHPNNKAKTAVYSWKKVESSVNNIIIGKLYIECYGEMEIRNQTTGDVCRMKYHTPGLLSGKGNLNRMTGAVYAAADPTTPVYVIQGYWDKVMEVGKVQALKGSFSLDGSNFLSAVQLDGEMQTLWKVPLSKVVPNLRPETYYFSEFTCCLNEPVAGCAPTDCRFRIDQRSMENGDYEGANKYKNILEDNQRERRKQAAKLSKSTNSSGEDLRRTTDEEVEFAGKKHTHPEAIHPIWFKVDAEASVKYDCQAPFYRYKGNYWERRVKQDWSGLPTDLFTVHDTV